jgi:hypothetical protein
MGQGPVAMSTRFSRVATRGTLSSWAFTWCQPTSLRTPVPDTRLAETLQTILAPCIAGDSSLVTNHLFQLQSLSAIASPLVRRTRIPFRCFRQSHKSGTPTYGQMNVSGLACSPGGLHRPFRLGQIPSSAAAKYLMMGPRKLLSGRPADLDLMPDCSVVSLKPASLLLISDWFLAGQELIPAFASSRSELSSQALGNRRCDEASGGSLHTQPSNP